MKYKIISLFSVLVFSAQITTAAAEPPADLIKLANSTFICKFKDHVISGNVPTFVSDLVGRGKVNNARHTYTKAFKGFSSHMSAKAAEKLPLHNPNIEWCEPNGIVQVGGAPANAGRGQGKAGGKPKQNPPTAQITPHGVERVGGPFDGTGLTAWIIDSGIDLDNADLNIDASRGKDVVKKKGKTSVDDVNGHGTHVAGTLAAINNAFGVVGVAAGATVIPVRILKSSSYGTIDDAIAGIDWVAENAKPGEVANMSAWYYGHNQAFHEAAENLAEMIPFIVIAGNDGIDLNDSPSEPAHVEHPNLYTVSAVDQSDNFAEFSNYGFSGDRVIPCDVDYPADSFPCMTVDYAAPGVDVTSLQPDGALATWWGTSMAAPHVAGIILLLQGAQQSGTDVAIGDPDGLADKIIEK